MNDTEEKALIEIDRMLENWESLLELIFSDLIEVIDDPFPLIDDEILEEMREELGDVVDSIPSALKKFEEFTESIALWCDLGNCSVDPRPLFNLNYSLSSWFSRAVDQSSLAQFADDRFAEAIKNLVTWKPTPDDLIQGFNEANQAYNRIVRTVHHKLDLLDIDPLSSESTRFGPVQEVRVSMKKLCLELGLSDTQVRTYIGKSGLPSGERGKPRYFSPPEISKVCKTILESPNAQESTRESASQILDRLET